MLRTGLESRKIHAPDITTNTCVKITFSVSNLLYETLQHQLNVKRENLSQLVFHGFSHSFGEEHGL